MNDEDGRMVSGEFQEAARTGGRPFLPICVICDIEENQRRISTHERKISETTKLTNPDTLKSIRSQHELYYFNSVEVYTLDVTYLTPTEAAERILERINALGSTNA